MLLNKYFYLTNCCCGTFEKRIKHHCKINSGSEFEMTEMNLQLATGITTGDLNYVVESKCCENKLYY